MKHRDIKFDCSSIRITDEGILEITLGNNYSLVLNFETVNLSGEEMDRIQRILQKKESISKSLKTYKYFHTLQDYIENMDEYEELRNELWDILDLYDDDGNIYIELSTHALNEIDALVDKRYDIENINNILKFYNMTEEENYKITDVYYKNQKVTILTNLPKEKVVEYDTLFKIEDILYHINLNVNPIEKLWNDREEEINQITYTLT